MGIEAGPARPAGGPSGAIGIGVGPGVGVPSGGVSFVAPSFEGAPSLGLLKSFGPKFESVSYQPIDSPIGKEDLENMVPYKVGMFESIGSISFSPVKHEEVIGSHLQGVQSVQHIEGGPELSVDVVSQAYSQPEPLLKASVVEEAQHWLGINEPASGGNDSLIVPNLGVEPLKEVNLGGNVLNPPQPEARRVARTVVSPSISNQAEAVYAPAIQEQLVEQIVKEDPLKVEDRVEVPSETRREEEIEALTIKYVEDEAVSKRRQHEIGEAIKEASAEAKKEGASGLEGWRIRKYFVPEHPGNRSGIAESGTPDGSLVETYQDISTKNYESEEQAIQLADSVVADKKPVKKAKEGKKVKERDIARILRDPFLKRHPVEEVVARIIKKTKVEVKPGQKPVEITTAVQIEQFAEGRIEDHPDLAEVFQKAATPTY